MFLSVAGGFHQILIRKSEVKKVGLLAKLIFLAQAVYFKPLVLLQYYKPWNIMLVKTIYTRIVVRKTLTKLRKH